MAVVAGELFHAVDRFGWVGFYRVVAPGVLKLGPYQSGYGCLMIPFDTRVCGAVAREQQTQMVTMCINLTGIFPVPRRCNLNWLSRCLTKVKISGGFGY